MSTLARSLTILVVLVGAGAGLVLWETFVAGKHESDASISKEEMAIFLRDFNPAQLRALSQNPEEKKTLLKNLKEVLAIGSEARKRGVANDHNMKNELENIEKAILAISYDQKINKDKGPMPPFGFVSEDEIKAFWDEDKPKDGISWIWNNVNGRWHESEFEQFVETKVALARKSGQLRADQEPSEQDLEQAKDSFARTRIMYYKAKAKLAEIPSLPEDQRKEWEEFKTKVDVQVRLQKAQLLSTTYVRDVLSKKVAVKEKEIKDYVAAHPELTQTAEKLNTAKEVLKKVKEGGDFAELAKEYSDDPGSKSRGGLYEGVVKGQFAPEFEAAIDKLEPGNVAPDVVKTAFGYHIIKLEKRGQAKGSDGIAKATYDTRHILISTMVKDPKNPLAREMPVEQFVKAKLEKEKQEKALEEILANNPVEVPEDFEVPEISEADIKAMDEKRRSQIEQMQRQRPQQGPPTARPAAPPAQPSGKK
ncbi:MAG: peptidylprolyl isomerase [Acidobacteriota bacterium]|nr:peptidylprolyl isomerase [Acidobacteriota bacterium]MDH3528148.1 peptidylprolyl isomerase [Acidobacteriota bacterium]